MGPGASAGAAVFWRAQRPTHFLLPQVYGGEDEYEDNIGSWGWSSRRVSPRALVPRLLLQSWEDCEAKTFVNS